MWLEICFIIQSPLIMPLSKLLFGFRYFVLSCTTRLHLITRDAHSLIFHRLELD